jgi:hypothetical protein
MSIPITNEVSKTNCNDFCLNEYKHMLDEKLIYVRKAAFDIKDKLFLLQLVFLPFSLFYILILMYD